LLSEQLAQLSAVGRAGVTGPAASTSASGPASLSVPELASGSAAASVSSQGEGVVVARVAQLDAQSVEQPDAHVRASLHVVNAR
jgi:hypothetical protein